MAFKFEQAQPEDIYEIMRIEDESFAPEVRERQSVFQNRLETFPGGNFVLVQNIDPRQLAGYFSAEIWNAIPPSDAAEWALGYSASERHNPEGTVLYVSSFAVEQESRRTATKNSTIQGPGGFLFKLAINYITARNAALRTIAFIVHEDWSAARHIYEKAGFSYTGRIDKFFTSAEKTSAAALIMQKEI